MAVHSVENCKSIFISWRWAISILIPALVTVATITWAGSNRVTSLQMRQAAVEKTIDRHSGELLRIHGIVSDLDSIKEWVRK